MAGILRAGDVISGQEAIVTINIGGNIENAAWVKSLTATLTKNKTEIRTLGHRGTQHKTTGWSGTGTMNIYYVTSIFRKLAERYANSGRDEYFTITVQNEDPTSTIGNQTVALYRVNFDSVVLASVDVENATLDEDIDFTFEDFAIISEFQEPELI